MHHGKDLSQSFIWTKRKEMMCLPFTVHTFPVCHICVLPTAPPPIPSVMNKPIFLIWPAFFTNDIQCVFLLKNPLHCIGKNPDWVISDWIQKSVQIQGLRWSFPFCCKYDPFFVESKKKRRIFLVFEAKLDLKSKIVAISDPKIFFGQRREGEKIALAANWCWQLLSRYMI